VKRMDWEGFIAYVREHRAADLPLFVTITDAHVPVPIQYDRDDLREMALKGDGDE